MTKTRLLHLAAAAWLGAITWSTPGLAQTTPPDPADDTTIHVNRTEDGRGTVSVPLSIPREGTDPDPMRATFDFGDTKGFGNDNKPVVNADKSLIGVTNFPATKTSYVHLFIRQPNGDLIVVNSVNGQVAKLLKGRWAKAAVDRLQVEAIVGRVVSLKAFDYERSKVEGFAFKVVVGKDGTLTLAR